MTASQIVHWITDHAAALWPVVSALLLVALRARTPEQWVALGERSPRAQGVIRLLRAVGLDPAKALSALSQIVTGRAPARAVQIADTIAPRETQAPPPPSGQSGRAELGALAAILGAASTVSLAAVILGAVLAGCPRLPPVVGCTPMAYRCTDDGRPQVCSSTQRWEPIGDESCAAGGAVCVVERTAHCASMQITASADGGTR